MPPGSHGQTPLPKRTLRGSLRHYLVIPALALSLVVTFSALGVISIWKENKSAQEAFLGLGGGLIVLLLFDYAMVIHEEWGAWPWFFERFRAWRRGTPGSRRPVQHAATLFYPVHIIDQYAGLAVAFALVAMGLWVLDQTADKSRFFSGFDVIQDRNIWTIWTRFMATSLLVGTGTGFASFTPTHWAGYLIYSVNGIVLFTYLAIVGNVMLGWFFEKDHDEQFDSHVHGSLYGQDEMARQQQGQQQQQQQQQYQTYSPQSYSDGPFATVEPSHHEWQMLHQQQLYTQHQQRPTHGDTADYNSPTSHRQQQHLP